MKKPKEKKYFVYFLDKFQNVLWTKELTAYHISQARDYAKAVHAETSDNDLKKAKVKLSNH
jgi:hypothetical protein